MRKRMGSRSPAAAALRMRTATCVLLVRARSPGLRDSQASSKMVCRSFRVWGLCASIRLLHTRCYSPDYTYRPPHARFSSVLCEPPFPTTRLYDCIMCRGVAGRLTSIHLQRMRVPFSSDAPGQSPLPGAFILCVKISGATWAQRSCPLWVISGHLQRTSRCPLCARSGRRAAGTIRKRP